ncbi:DAK2 domain-containing protein [uncultured Jatrophihabitans sp.]|uniref:DAK2 domain-containing protein n=1 Tax=uncultured Jatrophihabitans sp. TaxID=1610747 RepID=UPI0035C9FE93
MLDALDAAAVQRWSRTAVELLDAHRAQIDALNVFPVADSDTGANMLTTLRAADDAVAAACSARVGRPEPGAPAVLAAWASGAAAGALGNSGFIISQILAGIAAAAAGVPAAGSLGDGAASAVALADGLDRGATLARAAVVTPVDGTMLTVARAAADGATRAAADSAADGPADLAAVARAATAHADRALQRTPEQLPQLAQAGVVDAGGRAFVLVLDALVRVVTGEPATLAPVRTPLRSTDLGSPDPGRQPAVAIPAYEVQFALAADAAAIDGLKHQLAALGDSIAVMPTGQGRWKVHVHVDDVGAAIEAGVIAGRPHGISVVPLVTAAPHDDGPSAVLAVAPGAGLTHLFEREGVRVVDGGADDAPSVDDVVAAMRATGAREVVLVPNATRVAGLAESAAALGRAQGMRVWVVPTRSPVQGLAAVAVHDAARRVDDDVVAMAEAAAATRFAELVVAGAEALTAVGICQPGDVLGLIDGEVVEIGQNLQDVALAVVDRLLGVGAELMTVLVGENAAAGLPELIERHVRARAPLTDVCVYAGGQPDVPLIFGVE